MVRRSLLTPIAELEFAAKLLDSAADALVLGRTSIAAQLITYADLPEIMDYAKRIVGKLSEEVHRQVHLPGVLHKADRTDRRMPSLGVQREIFLRDGWRCRFCRVKVISKEARSTLIKAFPDEAHFQGREYSRHSALYALAVSLDHVVPHSRGGSNDTSNFVTTCYCCQFGRGHWTLEESELSDPRDIEPVVDGWDGLSRLHRYQVPAA